MAVLYTRSAADPSEVQGGHAGRALSYSSALQPQSAFREGPGQHPSGAIMLGSSR